HHALSHTHHPIRVSSMCARNVSNTLVFDDKKITLHKQHKNVVDARVHYTILKPLPNTTNQQPRTRDYHPAGRSISRNHTQHRVCDSRTQYRVCPSAPYNARRQATYPDYAGWMSERSDVPPLSSPHHHERVINWGSDVCSLERRSSSRTFLYVYLVTTSSQSPVPS